MLKRFLLGLLLSGVGLQSGQALALECSFKIATPQSCQIYQRNEKDVQKVQVQGTLSCELSEKAILIVKVFKDAKVFSTEEIALNLAPMTKDLKPLTLTLPMGWYRLETKLIRLSNSEILSRDEVPGFGIGDVFLTAGQSNSANEGERAQTPQDPRVCSYYSYRDHWARADDPQLGATGWKGSPWPAFGDHLARALDIPIGIVAVGVSGSSVSEWLPNRDQSHFTRITHALKALKPWGGARAMLWHQGEADVQKGMPTDTYVKYLKELIITSQKQAGGKLPWVVAQVSYVNFDKVGPYEKQVMENIRKAQEKIWSGGIALRGPTIDDLTGPEWRWDGIHLNEKGLKAHGTRWAEVVLRDLK